MRNLKLLNEAILNSLINRFNELDDLAQIFAKEKRTLVLNSDDGDLTRCKGKESYVTAAIEKIRPSEVDTLIVEGGSFISSFFKDLFDRFYSEILTKVKATEIVSFPKIHKLLATDSVCTFKNGANVRVCFFTEDEGQGEDRKEKYTVRLDFAANFS